MTGKKCKKNRYKAKDLAADGSVLKKAPFWACTSYKQMVLCTDSEKLLVLSGKCGQIAADLCNRQTIAVSDLLSGISEEEKPAWLHCIQQMRDAGVTEVVDGFRNQRLSGLSVTTRNASQTAGECLKRGRKNDS
jgi:hypothetical protein